MDKKSIDILSWLKKQKSTKYRINVEDLQASPKEIILFLNEYPTATISKVRVMGDLVISNCLELTFKEVVFEGEVTITNYLVNLSIELCEFMNAFKLVSLSVIRDLSIKKTTISGEVMISNLFIAGNYVSDKLITEMILGDNIKERILIEELNVKGKFILI